MELYLGTGSYSNKDWLGLLYPEGSKSSEFLHIYAQRFGAVELNASFYAIPGVKAFQGMVEKSEAKVRFAVKLHQSFTHSRDAGEEMTQRMLESVEPLREVGMLGPLLAQFPYSFHRTPENRLYLKHLIERFENQQLAVEFRGQDWDKPEVYEGLKEFGAIPVSVDYPPLSGLPKPELHVSHGVAYVRMHGRNKAKWWEGKNASERHDYLYSPDELRPWVLKIAEQRDNLSQVYVLLLNTTKGHALKNLAMLEDLFDEAGLPTSLNPEGRR
jgi:uncharacterized protein YecE (DUF72 family)